MEKEDIFEPDDMFTRADIGNEIDKYDYNKIYNNLLEIFKRYNYYKEEIKMIEIRYKSSLSFDNLGIFGSLSKSETEDRLDEKEKYEEYIKVIDEICNTMLEFLDDDEKIIFKYKIRLHKPDSTMMELLHINSCSYYIKRKNETVVKIGKWFGLKYEVSKEEYIKRKEK